MKTEATLNSNCAAAMRNLDALLDGGLAEPLAAPLREHLSTCESCSGEVELRRRMRQRLKKAVASERPSPYLGVRVMAQVRADTRRPRWMQRTASLGSVAAMLLILVGGLTAYQLVYVRYTKESQNAYISSLVRRVGYVLGAGLSDHVHCSVFRKYPTDPPPVEQLHQTIGREYQPLVDLVRARMPADYRIFIAHHCGYMDRKFIHIGLKSDAHLISLVLSTKKPGETYTNSELVPVLSDGGFHVYGASVQRFQIAGFETDNHLAWVVSDVTPQRTRELLLVLAPGIRNLLSKS